MSCKGWTLTHLLLYKKPFKELGSKLLNFSIFCLSFQQRHFVFPISGLLSTSVKFQFLSTNLHVLLYHRKRSKIFFSSSRTQKWLDHVSYWLNFSTPSSVFSLTKILQPLLQIPTHTFTLFRYLSLSHTRSLSLSLFHTHTQMYKATFPLALQIWFYFPVNLLCNNFLRSSGVPRSKQKPWNSSHTHTQHTQTHTHTHHTSHTIPRGAWNACFSLLNLSEQRLSWCNWL